MLQLKCQSSEEKLSHLSICDTLITWPFDGSWWIRWLTPSSMQEIRIGFSAAQVTQVPTRFTYPALTLSLRLKRYRETRNKWQMLKKMEWISTRLYQCCSSPIPGTPSPKGTCPIPYQPVSLESTRLAVCVPGVHIYRRIAFIFPLACVCDSTLCFIQESEHGSFSCGHSLHQTQPWQ